MNDGLEHVGDSMDIFGNEPMDLEQIKLTLAVMQLDPADRAVIRVADQRDAMQKRAFTIWVNKHLSEHGLFVNDLFKDFQSGHLLIKLIEILSGQTLSVEYGLTRVHCIQNVQRVLEFLQFRKVRIVNIRPDEIVDGNPKLTLGLIWIIILHFHLSDLLHLPSGVVLGTENALPPDLTLPESRLLLNNGSGSLQSLALLDETAGRNLLAWCRAATAGYRGVDINDFSSSWSDGRAFLAIIHCYKPHFFDYSKAASRPPKDALDFAFRIAEERLGITRLIYPEDMVGTENTVDSRSVIVYVSSLYDALALSPRDLITGCRQILPIPPLPVDVDVALAPPPLGSQLVTIADVSEEIRTLWSEYRLLAAELIQWLRATCDRLAVRHFPADLESMQQQVVNDLKRHRREELPLRERQRQQLVRLYADLQSAADANLLTIDPFMKIEHIFRLWKEYELALQKREMAVAAETSRLERLQLASEKMERECGALQTQEVALEKRMNEMESQFASAQSIDIEGELKRWMTQLEVVETGVNNLFGQVQILRNGRYIRTEQVYRKVCTLHQCLLELQRRYRNFLKVTSLSQSGDRILASRANGDARTAVPGGRSSNSLRWLVKQSKQFGALQAALDWIKERKETIANAPFGDNRKSIADATKRFELIHKEIEKFHTEVEGCRALRTQVSGDDVKFFEVLMNQIENQYDELMKKSKRRLEFGRSLLVFVERASNSMRWLREKETIEVTRIWSSPHDLKSAEIYEFFRSNFNLVQGLLREIQSQEQQFNEISTLGSSLHLEGHPSFDLIQTYLTSLDSHWAWLLQLTHCLETRLDRTVRFQQFFTEAQEIETFLTTKMKEINDVNMTATSGNITVEIASEFRKKIADMGEAIRGQGFLVDKLVESSDEIVDLVPPSDPHEPVISICLFAPNSEPHYMELAPEQSDPAIVTWPSGNFKKGERMTVSAKPSEFTLKLRHSNGEEIEAPAVCFLPARPCLEAKTRAQELVAQFQRLQVLWADTELDLHGRLLKATMQALPGTLLKLSAAEGQQLMRQLHEDTQRHLVGMRLANKPVQEVEVFQQESERCFKCLPNGNGSTVDSIEKNASMDLKRIETTLNALADHLRKRTGQVLPNQLATLEVVLKEHKEWSRSVNQIRDHLGRKTNGQDSACRRPTEDKSNCAALLAAANELINAGKATARRLAEVDAILTRLDSLQRELAGAEQKVVEIAARIHSPRHNLSSSKSSLRSDASEMEANSVQNIHDQLKDVTVALGGLRKVLEQLPHHLTALSTQGITKGTSAGNYHLPPPNTSLLEKSILSVSTRLSNLVNQIDSMNQELAKISQNYKTAITLRRGLALWLRETSDLVEAVGKRIKNRPHGNLASSTAARNLERASAEAVHCEARLKELNQTCEFLTRILEDSSSRGDAYKRAVSSLPFASMETANARFVGPPGIGIMDLVSLEASVANLNTQFQALKSKIGDDLMVIENANDGAEEVRSVCNTTSSLQSMESTRSLLLPCSVNGLEGNDVGDYFVTGGSRRRRRRKVSPSVPPEGSQMKRRPLKRKLTRYCVVSGFYLTSPKQSLRVETAITRAMIREGRVDIQRNLVYDSDSGAMITVGEALEKSVIVGLIFTKSTVKQNGETTYWLEIFHKRHDVYIVEGIYDVNARVLIPVEEALASNLVDPVYGIYLHTGTGETITLEDAHQQGLIRVVPQLRPPCEDLATRPFDSIHYRTVEGDFAVRSLTVTFKQKEDLFVQQEEAAKSDYTNVVAKISKLPLDLHLLGNLVPVTMTDGTAISAIKLPLVRRLASQNIPTIEVTRREPQPAHQLSLATALRRGWIDSHSGRLRSACGAVSQVNLFEAVEQRFVDPNSIIVRISGGDLDASRSKTSRTRYYSLASVLEAANTIARAERFISEASWKNELLKTLMTNNVNAADGEVSEDISPEDYSRLQSIIVHHGIKHAKGDKKMSLAKITLKPKQKKSEQPSEKLSGERMSLARAIRAGRFDPSTGIITTKTMQRVTLKEAVELEIIDEEISLVQDERTGYYRSVAHYLHDGATPIEIWLHWPMATLLLPEEVEPFGRKRVSRGQRIPYAAAQVLHLINPQSRTVLNPQTLKYVSILNAFLEGPLCGQRTVIYFKTSQEYLPVDILISTNPENVVNELLFNRSLCIELQEDICDTGGRTRPSPYVTVKTSVDSTPSPTVSTSVDLKTAVNLGWIDRETGFVNDPYTGHCLLLKEAVRAGLIDASRTVIKDPVTRQTSTLNVILKSEEPINVPYIIQLACLEDSQEPSTQTSSEQNQSTLPLPLTDGSMATTPITSELQVTNTPKGQEANSEKFITDVEYPLGIKDKAGKKTLDGAMENAKVQEQIGPDIKKLRSDLADAVTKVGAGLGVALGAAAVGGTLAYQSIKEKIRSNHTSNSQIHSPADKDNQRITSGPTSEDIATKHSEDFKGLFVPKSDQISTNDVAKRDEEAEHVNDDVEDTKRKRTKIYGSSTSVADKEFLHHYDEKTADDAMRSESGVKPLENLKSASEGKIFQGQNDKNLPKAPVPTESSILGAQDSLHSTNTEDREVPELETKKIREIDEKVNQKTDIEEMEFMEYDKDSSRPILLASMEVPGMSDEEQSPFEEQGYSNLSSRGYEVEPKQTSLSAEGWEANREDEAESKDSEEYSVEETPPITQNDSHSVDLEDKLKCEMLSRGGTVYPSQENLVPSNVEGLQRHSVDKTPSFAEGDLHLEAAEYELKPSQESKDKKTGLVDQDKKQTFDSLISLNEANAHKQVTDSIMETSEDSEQKPHERNDSATSQGNEMGYEVDLTKNTKNVESSAIPGIDQNAPEEHPELVSSSAENDLDGTLQGEPNDLTSTQRYVSQNHESPSRRAPTPVDSFTDTSKEPKRGSGIKKLLTNVGGVLAAAIGAPVVASVMAYNAAKDKLELRQQLSGAQNEPLELSQSDQIDLESDKGLTADENVKNGSKNEQVKKNHRASLQKTELPRGEIDDLAKEKQSDPDKQQQHFQPSVTLGNSVITESAYFKNLGLKSLQKGEELQQKGPYNKECVSHDPNQEKDGLADKRKEPGIGDGNDQQINDLKTQEKVDLIQEEEPIQSAKTEKNECDFSGHSVNYARLFSGVLKDLDAEWAWISTLQERIFNESSISLNDNDNQKLLDHYYEINNDLLTHKQVTLAVCERAESLAQEAIASLPSDKRSLLETKAREVRSALGQLTQETDLRIHLLAASLDNLEQLTFQLQDMKAWLTSVEKSLNKTVETHVPHLERLPAVQTQISRVGHELLSRQVDLASVASSAQKFLSCLENYNSAKLEYTRLVGVKLPTTQDSTESVVSSVETAVEWTQNKFNRLEASAREYSSLYSDAAMDFNEFTTGLTKCRESLDAAEKVFWQATRKLLAAGVDVNPRCEASARTPVNPQMIINPVLVRDQASSIFALEGDISHIKSALETLNALADDLSKRKLPAVSAPPSTIRTCLNEPLEAEEARLSSLSKELVSMEAEMKSLLGVINANDGSLADTSAWLEGAVTAAGGRNESTLLEASKTNNKLQAELSARELGLHSLLGSAQEGLERLETSGERWEAIEKAKEKVMAAQDLVDKCAELRNSLSHDKVLLDELEQKSSLIDKASKSVKAFVDSARSDLSAIGGGRIAEEESDRRLREMEEIRNSKMAELNLLEEVIDNLELEATDLGRESDITAAKKKVAAARAELSDLTQSIRQGRQTCKERLLRASQFEAKRGKLLDWLQSLEKRLDAGIFANRSTVEEVSLREQLSELEKIAAECNALESEVESACGLLKPTESSTDDKLVQDAESLRNGCERLKSRTSSMKSAAASSLRRLDTFSNTFMEADAWLTQRLNEISHLQLSSVDSQEILALTKKLDRFKNELETMAPKIDGLRRLGNELLSQKGAEKGSSRIREHMTDIEKKWQTLDALCKHRVAELSDIYSQALALDQCYNDLDTQLSRHSRTFETLSTVPVSKDQLQRLLSLQFGLIQTKPTIHAFEEAAGQFINSLPATTDASELSARVSGCRSRFDGLIGAIESRLETLQSALCAKPKDAASERQNLEALSKREISTDDEETAESKETILEGSKFNEKVKGSKDEPSSAAKTDGRGESEPTKGAPTEMDSKTSKVDDLKERMAAFQAWLDLESRAFECPFFESGSYPVTRSGLTKAMQRVETFMTLIESRDKHLASLRAEAEMLCPDLLSDLEKCQVSLGHVKRRYANKCEALQEILAKSKPIETELQAQQLTIDGLESQFLKDLDSTSRLESLQQDVMNHGFPPLDSQFRDLEQTLSKLGDESSSQSTQPLQQQEVELRQHLKRLESSLKRSIEGGHDGQKATSNLLTRADLIKRRIDELEAQLGVAGSENIVLDPDTLSSRLDEVNKITDRLEQCNAALKSLKNDKKDLPPVPLLESLLKDLKKQSGRISQAADEATERLKQQIAVARQLADQQKLLSSSLADARTSSPIQPHKPLPTPDEVEEYERQYLIPLRSQLQQLQKTGAVLSAMTQPGLGKRGLEQDLTATKAAVDSLFDVVSSVKERLGDTFTFTTAQVNSTRRLENLIQNVRDELEGQGTPSPSTNVAQLDAMLNKLKCLRNLLQSRRGSLELLAEAAKTEGHPDSVAKLIDDYQNVFAEVNSRINKVSDVLLRLKEFNSLYESYLGWLEDAELRFNKLPIFRDPAVTHANRVAELGKLSQECTNKTDSVIQLQTRGTELLGLCPDSSASVIKDRMEHVGSSFTEFFDKVNNASQGLESARSDISRLLESSAFLTETLPKLESRLRDGESAKVVGDELNNQVKPHVDSLTSALEEIRKNLPNALFLDLPSQRHPMTIGDLAVENVSRFNNLYSETMNASQKDQVIDMQVKNAYSKLRGDEKWLEQAMRRLDSKAQSQPSREILTLKEDTSPESASYSLAVLPARVEQIDHLISGLNAFRSELARRQPDIEAHLVEAKRLLDKVPYRNTEEDLAPILEGLVKRIIQQNKEIDGLLDAADARSHQALALSKSLFDSLARLENWMTSAENVLDQLPVAPLAVEEESDTLRKLHISAKTLEHELDGYKVTLKQASSTAAALSALIAQSEVVGINTKIQQGGVRFRKLAKRIRNRSIDLEDAVTNSIDVNDRLNVLNEVLNETRDLAATIGVRLEPPSHDLSPPHMPPELDLTTLAPSARVQQPVSMRSEYLGSQIAEGKAILDTLERRLPALMELTSSIEDFLSAPASEMFSTVERPSLALGLEEEPVIDANAMFRGRMLNRAQSLQKDWLQLHTKVSQRLTSLVEAHRLASEEFWLPLSNFQGDLIALRRSMDTVISERASRLPLEPSTYTSQMEALQNIQKQHEESGERLNALRGVGNKIINLLIDEAARSEGEKSILKKEINNAIREVSAIAQNITTTCEQQLVAAKDHLATAQKLRTDLNVFVEQLEKAENEFEAFEPVANNTDSVLELMKQLEEWSALVPPKHEQLENLNWVAGQLISVAGIPEVSEQPLSRVDGDIGEGENAPQVQQMLTLATTRWSDLNDAINHRRHELQTQLMALGDFDSALDALIQWIKMMQASIDGISVTRGDKKSLEFELSRAKIIQTNAARRQPDVVRINQEAKAMQQTQVSTKLAQMNRAWEKLKQSVVRKQARLEEALREAQNFYSRLDELRRECRRLEGKISAPGARLIGGLPDSAKQSLNRLLQLHNSVEKLGKQVGDLRSSSAGLLASAGSTRDHLVGHLDSLSQQQAQLAKQTQERLKQVQSGVARVVAFHNDLGDFIQWLTQAERRINQAPSISFVPSTLQLQLPAQIALRREIASKREAALTPLDRTVVFIGSNALEQDVVLVKNLLASAHSRWEKLFQKSADRNRQFAAAFKESQKLVSAWKELTDWLKEKLNTRLQESTWCSVSTQPDVLLRELAQHREFQRELGAHSASYDAVRRHLIKVKDKAPRDDLVELNRMLSELKYFWNAVCNKSLEKQKVLEEALLRSGQYKDAFFSLFEWINKIDSLLDDNEKKGCAGDVETVKQMEEAHRNLLAQLQEREASVTKLQTAASQLLSKCRPRGSGDAAELTDSLVMQEQLAGLNAQWTKVQLKAKTRSDNLKAARKVAEEFQKSCQDVFDYCAGAEYTLRKLSALPEGDDPRVMDCTDLLAEEKSVNAEVAAITSGMAAQESRVCDCLARGNRILAECKNNPNGASRIRQWMNAVNTRWEEMLDWSQKREAKLAQLSKDQRERRLTLDALISWLNTTEVILCSDRMYVQPTISMGPLSIEVTSEISSSSSSRFESGSIGFEIDTSQVERLLAEVGQIESELEKRRSQRDEILKHARKSDVDKKRQASSKGKASEHPPGDHTHAYASVRVNEMCEKWDRVVRIVKARQIALEERLAHANEVEKLKTFDFDNWRRRYLDWLNSKKARLIDMFHRYDLDRDGRLSRDEFVNAILESKFPTSRLEMEVVASIVDSNGDGYIDMKKFNTALRSTTVPKSHHLDLSKIEGSAIEHEAKHQTSLCTCHNTYRISKINGNMYKFGDSQKLRLVRILRSNVMVRVGGGWTPLTEFLVKNDPCRAAFWTGSESERKDAGFPEDQTHMMLKFHPRFRDGSSASVTCTDPVCSRQLSNMSRSSLKRSNPRHASMSGGMPCKCTSPVPTFGKDRLNKKDGRRVPVRSSLPAVALASHRKANSLVSFRQSSLSSSAHSLPVVEQTAPDGSHPSLNTEPVELTTEATVPPTSLSSSLSELPEDRKESSLASDMNATELKPAEESIPHSVGIVDQSQTSFGHLSSILERNEGDDSRPTSLLQNKEAEPDSTTGTSTTLVQTHFQSPLSKATSSEHASATIVRKNSHPEVTSAKTNLPHTGSQGSIGHVSESHPETASSHARTIAACFKGGINNERFRENSQLFQSTEEGSTTMEPVSSLSVTKETPKSK